MEPVLTAIWGKNAPKHGVAPSIILVNPKNASNVGAIVRTAACYGFEQVWWTGNRVMLDLSGKKRLPREERMKGYQDVSMIQHDRPFDQFVNATPVAVEVREEYQNLLEFEHPKNPVYVFGPEDGSIDSVLLGHCHQYVVIPTLHCLNLAMAVGTILWDRKLKQYLNGDIDDLTLITPGEWEGRGVEEMLS